MIKKELQLLSIFLVLIWLSGCNVTKHLKNNETLYTGGSVKIKTLGKVPEKKAVKQNLEELLPKPNTTVLGMRPKLWIYYNVNPREKKKGAKAWIRRKFGEPPVLIEEIDVENIEGRMLNILYNKGYFQAEIENQEKGTGKKIGLEFAATIRSPYRVKEFFYPALKSKIDSQILEFKEKTLIRPGDAFTLEKLEEERTRIDAQLKELGYFYFNPEFLLFKVDSTIGNRMINLYLEYKAETPQKSLRTYRMDEIFLNPDYSIADSAQDATNTVLVDNIHFLKKGNGMFRPKALTRLVFLKEDSLYSRRNHNITLNRLMGLDVFKYVNIRFTEVDSIGEGRLLARIQASPLYKKSLRAEVQGYSKSTNFAGPALQLSFRNRNAFRGAELLFLNLNTSFETQFAGQYKNFYSYEVQPQVQLFLPRFLLPFNIAPKKSLFVPRTKMELNARFQNIITRYRQNSINASFGYNWKETVAREHELNPIYISYINFAVEDSFQLKIDTIPSLAINFQNQLILGSTYTYTYNNLLEAAGRGRNHFYFNGNIDLSGNLFGVLDKALGITYDGFLTRYNENEPDKKRVRYSQYTRGEIDFRSYHDLSNSERIASRVFVGVGLPYGYSDQLPLAKQFYIGGPTSLRAFRARTIGPGLFKDTDDESAFFTQLGDMRIEGNLEYRFDLVSVVKGAFFIDAGNTWLTRGGNSDTLSAGDGKNPPKEDQVFKPRKLIDELAIGAGFGLRVDVSFLVLRLDLATPLRQFWFYNKSLSKYELKSGKDRWTFNEMNFTDPMWRRRNLVLNIAIGYPF